MPNIRHYAQKYTITYQYVSENDRGYGISYGEYLEQDLKCQYLRQRYFA